MKRLILVCGANGIGKSTACRSVVELLPHTAFIDSDYCRFMNPFSFSEEETAAVISNISTLMINYFRLSTINDVLFSYGFHGARKAIFQRILQRLSEKGIEYDFCPIILTCSLEEHIRRMQNDRRDAERIRRAVEKTRSIYDEYDYPKIDITFLSAPETAEKIIEMVSKRISHDSMD